ncbi:MAG: transposase [Gammaproteobacteria bacterium]|nr:transposase [Gammaproteobacteria bacterium]
MNLDNKPGYRSLRKGRCSQENGIYFITTVTRARTPWFREFRLAHRMCRIIDSPESLRDSQVLCWVVMPDHVHLLLQLKKSPLSKTLNQFKSRTARLMNREIGRTGRFWADGFHDHGLRREEDVRDLARYIIANPLRASLTRRYGDYPFWNAIWL